MLAVATNSGLEKKELSYNDGLLFAEQKLDCCSCTVQGNTLFSNHPKFA